MPPSENISQSSVPPAPISVIQENPLVTDRWDELIAQHPGASIFHSTAWAKVLSETYGFTPLYLATLDGKKSLGALPLLEVDSWLTGKRGVSLPFTDECETLGLPGAASSSLLQAALQIGRARGWKYLELRGGKNLFNEAKPSLGFYGHKLNLTPDADWLFKQCEGSVRRAIRKAEQSGLQMEFSQSPQAISDYCALHCRTRREHGLPPQPFQFFRSIHEHILKNNSGVVVTARLREQPVASAIYFYRGPAAIYKFGASLKAAWDSRANNLVMWKAMEWLAGKGIKELRFGRTSLHNEGLRRYKLGWGAEEYAINYYKYDFRADAVISETDASSGWHNALFRALPLPLAKCVGKILYRHVA